MELAKPANVATKRETIYSPQDLSAILNGLDCSVNFNQKFGGVRDLTITFVFRDALS